MVEMSQREWLYYCITHAESERAGFVKQNIQRSLKLACECRAEKFKGMTRSYEEAYADFELNLVPGQIYSCPWMRELAQEILIKFSKDVNEFLEKWGGYCADVDTLDSEGRLMMWGRPEVDADWRKLVAVYDYKWLLSEFARKQPMET